MKRRDFIKTGALASGLTMMPEVLRAFSNLPSERGNNKKLVVIQLAGGNDGLNTVVPYNNDIYYRNRPNIAIDKNEVLKLTDELGFNPNMPHLKNLYDNGYMSIINNVGYKNPNRSHFRSTDIWQTASKSNEYLTSGWMGRFIDNNGAMPYNGIEIDDSLSLIMKGEKTNGIATKAPRILYNNMQTPFFKEILNYQKKNDNDGNLKYLYKTMHEARESAEYIFDKYKTSKSKFDYPKNPFGLQLKTTAELINSGINTKVYFVTMGGFDTHVYQLNKQNPLLKIYSKAVDTFVKDLEKNDTFKDTMILTFSEFGRRVKQNAAFGTDHGAANNVHIIAKDLKTQGFYNENPNLSDLDDNGDVKYSVDFKNIYSTILSNWLDVNDRKILGRKYGKMDFI